MSDAQITAPNSPERIPFFLGPSTLLIPFLIFAAVSVYLFVFLQVFDLMALAGAGLVALVSGALLTRSPAAYWRAVVAGAASPLTAMVLLLLMAAGIFSAMMKAAGLAQALALLTGGAIAGTPLLTPCVFLLSSLLATATGSSISTILAASPIFLPFGAALGCDVPMLAGAILSGAIFGDNLAPVSDVAIISAMTQSEKDGRPLDLGEVVRTRFPFAIVALLLALPFYALGGSATGAAEATLKDANLMSLVMLIPVALLIYVAIRSRDALHAVTLATVVGIVLGLVTGVLTPASIVSVKDGAVSGIITGGIANVAGIMLMCLALFGFTGVIERAGLSEAAEGILGRRVKSPAAAEALLALVTVLISTCLAAVTSVAVALAGQLANRLLANQIDPYRRAYLLAGFANSIPVILPFSAFSLITLSAASGLGDASLTPFSLMTATYYPVALFVVFGLSILTGIGRPKKTN
ncbi:Na+/H+ antiporter NhaC family protein [Sutterella sp.]|uniref:Na+/H+ antiporter NhaC family protein n=1 Tax=Sutterella sp. TaxID=1981025 RepID=UPI0026E06974|nr:Na+/H+ antiporter NhaC family protein [Sutterella sp.]MDO5531718.1 Na+/H+ antiporter NhaC family protein [Sutterella sp.]